MRRATGGERSPRTARWVLVVSCSVLTVAGSRASWAADATPTDNAACFSCHGDPSAGRVIDEADFAASIHGRHRCTSCHTGITDLPHDVPLAAVTCPTCHHIETEVYLGSDHGIEIHAGISQAASCRDCHGNAHALRNSRDPSSPVSRGNIPGTCGQCHAKTEQMEKFHLGQAAPIASYTQSVHGMAQAKGAAGAAVCTDCHGSHYLHRATNSASKPYLPNLPGTCGKCHENIRQTYLRSIHGM